VAVEGFALHPDKTTVAPAHTQQRLLGLVVNETAGVARRERDALRALLHNCTVTGPAAQNREDHPDFRAHLQGRISWVAAGHPGRLARLTTMLEAITW
jgi:RNA-directed DNA polymerase